MPSSLGVNPQMTIMAIALRAAEAVDARLDDLASASSGPISNTRLRSTPDNSGNGEGGEGSGSGSGSGSGRGKKAFAFAETMTGHCWLVSNPERARPMQFRLSARSAEMKRFLGRREVAIEGTIDVEGLATNQPLTGTLGMDVLLTRKLPYDFTFTGDDGGKYRFVGEKNVRALALLDTMSRLPGEIRDEAGEVVARATLFFDLKGDSVRFLRSFRLTAA